MMRAAAQMLGPQALPLKAAYRFARTHGLEREIAEASADMKNKGAGSGARKGFILDLFQRRKIFDDFKSEFWPFGNTPKGENRRRRYLNQLKQYNEDLAEGSDGHDASEEEEALDAIATTFGLERDLQAALRQNIGNLETGLSIIDDGKERKVASGFIDITARDKAGAAVVIELKPGLADRDAIAQILTYMGDLMGTEKSVRGMLVAGEFTPRAVSAARAARDVQLIQYGFKFSFKRTPLNAAPGERGQVKEQGRGTKSRSH